MPTWINASTKSWTPRRTVARTRNRIINPNPVPVEIELILPRAHGGLVSNFWMAAKKNAKAVEPGPEPGPEPQLREALCGHNCKP